MTTASRTPRGWIVAVRPRGKRGQQVPYAPAFAGATFAVRSVANGIADRIRANNPHLSARVFPEGIVK